MFDFRFNTPTTFPESGSRTRFQGSGMLSIDSSLSKTGVFAKKRPDLYKKITFSFDILYMYYYGVCKILIFFIARKIDSNSSNCFFKSCSWDHNLLIYNSFFSISLSTTFQYAVWQDAKKFFLKNDLIGVKIG